MGFTSMAAAQGAHGQRGARKPLSLRESLYSGAFLRRVVLAGYWRVSGFRCIGALSLRESLYDGARWLLAGEWLLVHWLSALPAGIA